MANQTPIHKFVSDNQIIWWIAERAIAELPWRGGSKPAVAQVAYELERWHEKAPLRLADLLAADLSNLAHDVGGIVGGREMFEPRFTLYPPREA